MDTDNGKVNTILSEEVLIITEAQHTIPCLLLPLKQADPLLLLLTVKHAAAESGVRGNHKNLEESLQLRTNVTTV